MPAASRIIGALSVALAVWAVATPGAAQEADGAPRVVVETPPPTLRVLDRVPLADLRAVYADSYGAPPPPDVRAVAIAGVSMAVEAEEADGPDGRMLTGLRVIYGIGEVAYVLADTIEPGGCGHRATLAALDRVQEKLRQQDDRLRRDLEFALKRAFRGPTPADARAREMLDRAAAPIVRYHRGQLATAGASGLGWAKPDPHACDGRYGADGRPAGAAPP